MEGEQSKQRRMRVYSIDLHVDCLGLTNAKLGEMVRQRLKQSIDESAARIQAGKDAASAKVGHAIEIDGVKYTSRARAREALGLSFEAFKRKYPNPRLA